MQSTYYYCIVLYMYMFTSLNWCGDSAVLADAHVSVTRLLDRVSHERVRAGGHATRRSHNLILWDVLTYL